MARRFAHARTLDRPRRAARARVVALLWVLAAAALMLLARPAGAQTIIVERWTADEAPVELTWTETVMVGDADRDAGGEGGHAKASQRFVPFAVEPAALRPALASYGPFRLVAPDTVEMAGTVDSASPRDFAALMAAHPGVRRLVMVDCPGSIDETANHVLARAVRRAGLETHVPQGGSVRSGAVELFLAGVRRSAHASAEFGVHSWRDEDGYEASDFPADDPVHAEYLSYYRDMGLSAEAARRFYALTNSVPFDDVRYLGARDMAAMGLAEVAG
jgi:hypothetical protein